MRGVMDGFVRGARCGSVVLAVVALGGCSEPPTAGEPGWTLLGEELDAALMSVWGSGGDDVWAVGADTGEGPLVVHFDGSELERLDTGARGDLWWVFGFRDGPVFAGGSDGLILRYEGGSFTAMETPGDGTVFGLWGANPGEMWAVGGAEGGADGAFAWRLEGDTWAPAADFPEDIVDGHALWKVWGSGPDDVWMVGTAGVALHSVGGSFENESLGGGESLFTVHQAEGRFVAVGGIASGLVFENAGNGWERVDDGSLPGLSGVHMTSTNLGFAVGRFGAFAERRDGTWTELRGPDTNETLHAVWADPRGGAWVVGGQLDVPPLSRGVLAHYGVDAPKGRVP
jgi:hypothetical protein